jgi:hypothetical protein
MPPSQAELIRVSELNAASLKQMMEYRMNVESILARQLYIFDEIVKHANVIIKISDDHHPKVAWKKLPPEDNSQSA